MASSEFVTKAGKVIPFDWVAPHSVDNGLQVKTVYPIGARYPTVRAFTAQAGAFKLTAHIDAIHTDMFLDMLESGVPIGITHEDCTIPGCDVPKEQWVWVTNASRQTLGGVTRARNVWRLDCTPSSPDTVASTPKVTWGNYPPFRWEILSGMTWKEVKNGVNQQ